MQNPLFPSNDPDPSQLPDYLRTSSQVPAVPTQSNSTPIDDRTAAADLVRQKLAAIYAEEPAAAKEMEEVKASTAPLSKHQLFMRGLQTSGKSLAEIQNAWHEYYADLPDSEKHEVWREFYTASRSSTPFQRQMNNPQPAVRPQTLSAQPIQLQPQVISADFTPVTTSTEEKVEPSRPTVADIKKRIRDTVTANGKLGAKSHFQSLGFGLATGAVVVFIFLFGFFNEVFITPFIQPPRHVHDTPVIVDTTSAPASATPEVIIPKINVEIPTDYSQTSTQEAAIETALNSGVVHYPTTVLPGQAGNAAFFGHSSNNIFNPGKYKFAFVLLHKLTNGDTFYLTYQGKTYAYEVISHQIVPPSDVGVLGPVAGQTATATLITCDPPGTSINRLVVVGKQVSPDPSDNTAPTAPDNSILATTEPSAKLPGNGPTLWSRMWHAIF